MKSYPLKAHFSEDRISAPRGCCAPKFLYALENDQVLLALFAPETGAPLTTFFKAESKIALKCSVLDEGFWSQRKQLHETLPRDVLLDGCDNAGTTFRGHRPLKIWECKKRAKLITFNNNFQL